MKKIRSFLRCELAGLVFLTEIFCCLLIAGFRHPGEMLRSAGSLLSPLFVVLFAGLAGFIVKIFYRFHWINDERFPIKVRSSLTVCRSIFKNCLTSVN